MSYRLRVIDGDSELQRLYDSLNFLHYDQYIDRMMSRWQELFPGFGRPFIILTGEHARTEFSGSRSELSLKGFGIDNVANRLELYVLSDSGCGSSMRFSDPMVRDVIAIGGVDHDPLFAELNRRGHTIERRQLNGE